METRRTIGRLLYFSVLAIMALLVYSCGYLQVNPPPDVKADPETESKVDWLAASSNMLAAAGYGYGSNIQARADNIYSQMLKHFGSKNGGWTDAALQWWITSVHNEWPDNPYKEIKVIGNKNQLLPWTDPEGSRKIASFLRKKEIVSAYLSWPVPESPPEVQGGHVINCWGDDLGEKRISNALPSHLRVTDCFRNRGGIVQTYKYDDFNTFTPDGRTQEGWFISYDANQPFITNVTLLSMVTDPESGNTALFSRIMVKLENDMFSRASSIRVNFLHDRPVLRFNAYLKLESNKLVQSVEKYPLNQDPVFNCSWNLNKNDFQDGSFLDLVIESSGMMETWTGISNGGISGGEDKDTSCIPGMSFKINGLPVGAGALSPGACGGYYILRLTFSCPDSAASSQRRFFETLLMKQYSSGINPEKPILSVTAPDGYRLEELKAGQSYGFLDVTAQQEFDAWLLEKTIDHDFMDDTLSVPLGLRGVLPYPESENYLERLSLEN